MAVPVMTAGEHVPSRPSWDCRRCGNPWPCAPGKAVMTEDFRGHRIALLVYLAAQLCDAIDDMPANGQTGPSPDLYERFIAWARADR